MFSNLFRTALVLAAFAAPVAAPASEPAPRRDQGNAQSGPPADRQAPVELVCRSVAVVGGAGGSPMVCMTAADWRRAEQ